MHSKLFAFPATVALLVPFALHGAETPPTTVETVDLEQYTGVWYEIAKIPNRFQDHCVSDTTAEYTLRGDGRIDVVNRCVTDFGEQDKAQGVARITDRDSQAKLEVSFVSLFGWQLFWGDYWILDLGEDYDYAVIGHPKRQYGWILSRTVTLDEETLKRINEVLREQGYNPDDFKMSPQSTRG